MKRCIHCGKTKPFTELVKNKNMKDGFKNECKECHNIIERKRYYSKTKEERYSRETYLRLSYGITIEDYNDLLSSFNNQCFICGTKNDLVIDHCHATERIRGILCRSCNSAIGKLGDTLDGLNKALEYIKRYG